LVFPDGQEKVEVTVPFNGFSVLPNKNKENTELPQHLYFIRNKLKNVLDVIEKDISPIYFVLDGAFGNNNSLQL
jgi:hypothetical protein